MLMSAKTPGYDAARLDSKLNMRRRQQLALHPPLLVNIGTRASLTDNEGVKSQSSLLFGPDGSMFLSIDPNDVQLFQPVDQGEGLPTLLSAAVASSSLVPAVQSLSSVLSSYNTNQPSITSSIASASTTTIAPSTTSLPLTSSESSASQVESQSVPQSRTQAGFVTAISSFAIQTGVTSTTTPSTLLSGIPSSTTSQALSSPSSTSELQRDVASLPRVAEIVIGIVGAISLIAFLATLGSWIYKQHHRKREHAEVISITSFDDTPSGGFFGCLKKRSNKHPDDISELGFGLGRATFFSEANSGDGHHHVGLARDAENAVLKDTDRTSKTFSPSNPFADHFGGDGFTRRAPSTTRRLRDDGATDAASSISIFPYQHLALANALGGASVTPLTVANVVPCDTRGDEGEAHNTAAPSSVSRCPSVGTPRIGVSNPRFMSLVEDEALAVPWAPLDIRHSELRSVDENKTSTVLGDEEVSQEGDTGIRRLQLSRTETLTLAVSTSFSRRLGRSFSKTSSWRNVITRPPPGIFQVDKQYDNTDGPFTTSRTDKHWATTLKNNFYSALSAVGSSIHGTNTDRNNVDLEAPPVTTMQSIPELTVVPYRSEVKAPIDPLEDILTPSPAKVASVRLERTKGSIIRGHLGIPPGGGLPGHGMGLRFGLESLSRSSTLSTCWSDDEKEPDEEMVRKAHMRMRGLSRNSRSVQRSDTSSTLSSVTHPVVRDFMHPGRGRVGTTGRHMYHSGKRPRFSRLPVSQSSMWSSTSYASTDGEKRDG